MIYRSTLAATPDYLYATAFNKTEKELKSIGPTNIRPTLEVWNWKGEPVKRVGLDKPALEFAISEKHGKLYGVNPMIPDKIYVYDLP